MTSEKVEVRRSTWPPVVEPRLQRLLIAVLLLFALLAINSVYLGAVTLIE